MRQRAIQILTPVGIAAVTFGLFDSRFNNPIYFQAWVGTFSIWVGLGLIGIAVILWLSEAALITQLLRNFRHKEPGQLHDFPDLPPHYLPRPEDLSRLKALLLDGTDKVAISGAQKYGALQGMGGVGKTVLAVALARDEDVRRAFPDGIFWQTVGREGGDQNLRNRQAQLLQKLTKNLPFFDDVQGGRSHLEDALRGKACLVVLDDVWRLRDVQHLDAVGPGGRVLFNTRDSNIARDLRVEEYSVDTLGKDDALDLLAETSGFDRVDLPDIASDVAEECGYLPLALALTGLTIDGRADRWPVILQALRNADWEQIGADHPYPQVFAAIEVSVTELGDDAERYMELAVFQEDAAVPEAPLQKLWQPLGMSELEVGTLVTRLVSRGLASTDGDGRLVLHDLQGDFVRKRLGPEGVISVNNRLLGAYWEASKHQWAEGPNDGYFFQNLAYHLFGADRAEDLKSLLLDFNWLQAKLDGTDSNSLLADYDLLPEDRDLRLVKGAIRLSSHVVAGNKSQLAGQVIGRLLSSDSPKIRKLWTVRINGKVRPGSTH